MHFGDVATVNKRVLKSKFTKGESDFSHFLMSTHCLQFDNIRKMLRKCGYEIKIM